MSGASLFCALWVRDVDPQVDDPDAVVDRLVDKINGGRTNDRSLVNVGGIPAPQWLTLDTLANLRAAAATPKRETPHPLAVDLCEMVDEMRVEWRELLAHVVTCEPCRRGVLNMIQTAQGWPDLFGGET